MPSIKRRSSPSTQYIQRNAISQTSFQDVTPQSRKHVALMETMKRGIEYTTESQTTEPMDTTESKITESPQTLH